MTAAGEYCIRKSIARFADNGRALPRLHVDDVDERLQESLLALSGKPWRASGQWGVEMSVGVSRGARSIPP